VRISSVERRARSSKGKKGEGLLPFLCEGKGEGLAFGRDTARRKGERSLPLLPRRGEKRELRALELHRYVRTL